MRDVTWHEGCPVPLADLRVLELPFHTDAGSSDRGHLVVHANHAEGVTRAFRALWDEGFPLASMRPMRDFGGDDDASMAADNTSAFNCRPVAGGGRVSEHAYGHAVDVNPLRNPYVRGSRVTPPAGSAWLDRDGRPGVITADGPVVAAFDAIGWRWGGRWTRSKDYQHFSATGR